MKKVKHKNKKPSGVRCSSEDLSSDYKGHIAHNGTVAPWKYMGKSSDAIAPVA